MKNDKIGQVLLAIALVLILVTSLAFVSTRSARSKMKESDVQARDNGSGLASSIDKTQVVDGHEGDNNDSEKELDKQTKPDSENEINSHLPEPKLKLWPERPEGESDLERIKRLISPLEDGEPGTEYLIRVFKDIQMVCVFTDEGGDGSFQNLLHAFICSAGIEPYNTPNGLYEVGIKHPSGFMLDASYCKYCTEFISTYYFHAPPSYMDVEEAGVRWQDYNMLGEPASHGCIRLTTRDAKWIYNNCPAGTIVEVLESSEGFSQLPEKIDVLKMAEGEPSWDPTNDNPANPYQQDPSRLLPYNRVQAQD